MPYYITSDNCKLYYEEKGKGKAVVFVHGWSCNRHFFKKQLSEFQKKYKVLSYDLRGHGDSERPEKGLTIKRFAKDLKELMEYRELKDITIIGWSMGVHIILEYILQFGCNNINKLVFIDMTAKMVTDKYWSNGIRGGYSLKNGVDFLESMAINWEKVAEGFVPGMFGNEFLDKTERDRVLREEKKNTPHVMINMWLSLIQSDYRHMLSQIEVPTLITYGKSKSLYEPECSEYIRDNITNAQIAAFRGGHIHFIEDAENFNREVIEFIG